MSATADAEACSAVTQQVRNEQAAASQLPDCRAYEQVSPVGKTSADALGSVGLVQTSLAGDAVSYYALEPFPGTVGSAELPSYLAARSPSGDAWSTQGLELLAPPNAVEGVVGVTEDASKSIVEVGGEQTSLSCEPALEVCAGFTEKNFYLHDNLTDSFQLLASQPRVSFMGFADATVGGSRILFETETKLTPEAAPGLNLYLWDEAKPPAERISLAGVLPASACGTPPCVPAQGSFAGPGGPAVGRPVPGNNLWPFYTQNSMSRDGSRVFFSDIETGIVYMREPDANKTVQVSAGKEAAFWRAATRDGSYVFYTEGEELYRFNVKKFEESAKPEPEALAEAREQLTTEAEGVLGLLGISEEDGSYAYFAAPGVLATNVNGHGEEAIKGANNVYEWHNGTIIFIVALPDGGPDWTGVPNAEGEARGPSGGEKSSRVTPDGKALLFYSHEHLTSYDNGTQNEFYLYSAEAGLSSSNPVCVSCNPTGTRATGQARLEDTNEATLSLHEHNGFLMRNLAGDGRRVFFQTEESLIPGDANLTKDVYEWEADGEGSCASEAENDGCLFLISTGQAPQESYFGDASTDGSNAFFFTRQPLAGQDQDNNIDLYDARAEGGIPAQNPSPAPVPCAQEATCRESSSNAPAEFGVPPSTTFSGAGNLSPLPQPLAPPIETPAQIRAKKLVKALKACRSKAKARRKRCEAAARKRYGSKAKPKSQKSSRGGRR